MGGNTSQNEDVEEDIVDFPTKVVGSRFVLPMDCVGYIISFSSTRVFFNVIMSCKSIYQYLSITKTNCCQDQFTIFQKPKKSVSFVSDLKIHQKLGNTIQDSWISKYFLPHQLRKLDTSEVLEYNKKFNHDKVLETFGSNLVEYRSVYSSELIGKMKNLGTLSVSPVLELPRIDIIRNRSKFQSEHWSFVRGLSFLTRVYVFIESRRYNEKRGYIDLTLLPSKQIEILTIELNCSLKYVNIEKLSEFSKLKKLHCREICYDDKDFQSKYNRISMKSEYLIGCIGTLERLQCDSIEGGVMQILRKNLKELSLFEWKEELVTEEYYQYFDSIESLNVEWGYLPPKFYSYLKNVKKMSFPSSPFTVDSPEITDEDVLSIGTQLQVIGRLFSNGISDELFKNSGLNITCLSVGCENITDEMLKYVQNLEKLEISMNCGNFTGSGLKYLKKLKDLDFWGASNKENTIYDISRSLLGSQKTLVRLVLNGSVSCSDEILMGAENLEVLSVHNAEEITNRGISELKKKLRVLKMYGREEEMKINDDVFIGFEKLEHLVLPKKKVGRNIKKLMKNTPLIVEE